VDQTFANLSVGGKYRHLLGNGEVEVIKFSEIPSYAAWHRILEQKTGLTILVSTVAAWNSTEKDERLNVHREHADWGEKSRWDQLKSERNRPLWVVYDEAHNTTSEQVELLDDLDPVGFFIASASAVKGKLQHYLTLLPPDARAKRIASVSTRAVVDAQLLKSTISVADYDSEPEEMLRDVVERRSALEEQLRAQDCPVTPKAIYVVESSNAKRSGKSRPIAIWNTLVSDSGVLPQSIAVCTDTKNLPRAAVQVKTIAQLTEAHAHIIFIGLST
jgi:type III restriction enzyme